MTRRRIQVILLVCAVAWILFSTLVLQGSFKVRTMAEVTNFLTG